MTFRGSPRRTLKGTFRGVGGRLEGGLGGDFKQDFIVKLRSGQVWFSLQLKFNYVELNSEVGRIVFYKSQ